MATSTMHFVYLKTRRWNAPRRLLGPRSMMQSEVHPNRRSDRVADFLGYAPETAALPPVCRAARLRASFGPKRVRKVMKMGDAT